MKTKKNKSKVYLVESPHPTEILKNVGEAKCIKSVLEMFNVPVDSYLIVNRTALQVCFAEIANDIIECDKICGDKIIPYLHFSCHGESSGLRLAADKLSWYDIAEELNKVNEVIGYFGEENMKYGRLTICMSACEGIHAQEIQKHIFKSPYVALVGSKDKPTWQETITAFTSFYYTMIHMDGYSSQAFANMNAAVGKKDLFFENLSENFKKAIEEQKRTKSIPKLN